MRKIFYSRLVFSIFVLIFNSCTSPIHLIKNKFIFDQNFKIYDNKIFNELDEYKSFYKKELKSKVVIICSKENLHDQEIKEYYISAIQQDSQLLDNPCSGSFIYKDEMVLVYSKKIGYINPINYPVKFLNKIRKKIVSDWYCYEESCKSDNVYNIGIVITGIDRINKIKNGNSTKVRPFYFDIWNYCYGKKRFSYTNYVNLDNFRTIYLEDCDD